MTNSATPQIVGVIFSRADLQRALRMRNPPDLFELRLDALVHSIDAVRAAIERLPAPLIITARDPREGGANDLSLSRRRALFLEFLPRAAFVDVELRSARSLAPVLQSAGALNLRTIISFHDFHSTPPASRLDEIVSRARSLGADLVKIATRTDTPAQLETLLNFFQLQRKPGDVVAMGIGKLGRASRLQLARRGCLLNYAHLGSAVAAGQLSIRDLRHVLQ
jgi:3-dehydroquinate dehydratase type I